jgi:hypothetical protein
MADYNKSNRMMVKYAGLIRVIADENLDYEDVLWTCKGKCYDVKNPKNSATPHMVFGFPSGTLWYICTKCGATVIYDNESDMKKGMLPTWLEIEARDKYDDFDKRLRKAINNYRAANRREVKKHNERKKNANKKTDE